MHIRVETKTDPRGDQTPCGIVLGTRRVGVAAVLDRWSGTDHCYFKVRGEDGNLYILRRDDSAGQWDLALFNSPRGETISIRPPPRGKPRPPPH